MQPYPKHTLTSHMHLPGEYEREGILTFTKLLWSLLYFCK